MATLQLYSLTVAHGDTTASSTPAMKFVDWKRALANVAVQNPKSESLAIPPGVERLVFDGSRTLTVDGTSAFDIALSTLSPDLYRLTHTAGAAPGFRTARTPAVAGKTLTLTAQANGALLAASTAGAFTGLQVGDEVFVPGLMTGDSSSPFNAINQGRWAVLGVAGDGSSATLVRPAGMDFQGFSESVLVASADQFLAYGADGVQEGDSLDLSAGFGAAAQRSFEVAGVTSKWIEFRSSSPLAPEAGVLPGAAGLKVYSASKRFLRIEADQECVVKLNGDAGSSVRLSPWLAGDPEQIAEFTKVGPSWSLRILNRSAQTLHVNVISAE